MLDIFHKLPGAARKFLETQGECMLDARAARHFQ